MSADIAHGFLFLYDTSENVSQLVTFDDPTTIRWSRYVANWKVSLTGTYVGHAEYEDPDQAPVQVVSTADGSTLSQSSVDDDFTYAWESARRYLVVTYGRIARCDATTGACTPATKTLKGRITMAAA